jgi:hypothetical protein
MPQRPALTRASAHFSYFDRTAHSYFDRTTTEEPPSADGLTKLHFRRIQVTPRVTAVPWQETPGIPERLS